MFENVGFVTGTIRSRAGRPVSGATAALVSVIGSSGQMVINSPEHKRTPMVETEKDGSYSLVFLWSAADAGAVMNNVAVQVAAFLNAPTINRFTDTNGKGSTRSTGVASPDLMGKTDAALVGDLTSGGGAPGASGLASFAKTLILKFRQVKLGPLHLPKKGYMSTENYGIVAWADVDLDR